VKHLITPLLVVVALVAGYLLGSPAARDTVSATQAFNIAFVNYRGRTDIDKGFEEYLYANQINAKITYYDADRDTKKLDDIRAELQKKKPDLVVTFGTTTTLSMFGTYKDPRLETPGIFTLVTSPVLSNIVPNFSSSLRNITGTIHVAPLENQVRLMLAYREVKKIGMLYTPSEINSVVIVDELKQLAEKHRIEVVFIPFAMVDGKPSAANTREALLTMKKEGVGWLYLPPDSFLGQQTEKQVIPMANELGIPTFASTEQLMLTGATFGLLSSYYELGVIAAGKAVDILVDGKRPATIPIDRPPRFLRKVNVAAAEKLGFGNLVENLHLIEPIEVPVTGQTK
jgi:putative tryptophan/tyrosine transport system substrate-binding protein